MSESRQASVASQSLPPGTGVVYSVTVACAAITLLAAAFMAAGVVPMDLPGSRTIPDLGPLVWPTTLVFTAVFWGFQRQGFVFYWRDHSTKISFDEIALFLGFIVLPLPHVVLGVTVAMVMDGVLNRRDLVKGTFNTAQYTLAAAAAAATVGALRFTELPPPWAAAAAPIVFATASSTFLSILFSRIREPGVPRTSALDVYRQRFGAWAIVSSSLGASLGIILYALYALFPPAVLVALPVLFYLRRFGHLSEWADAELKAHQRLASVSTAVAGRSDLDDVADRVLDACRQLFDCGEAQLVLREDAGGSSRVWRRTFATGGAGAGGVTAGIVHSDGERIGEIHVFPRLGQRAYGEREHHLLRTVAASAAAAAANAHALTVIEGKNRELAASEGRYRSLFETANVFVHVLDEDGRVVDTNPAARAGLGHRGDALAYRPLLDILPREDQAGFRRTFDRLKGGGELRGVETRFLTRDGDALDVLLDAKALAEDAEGARRFVIISRDITSLKAMEGELRSAVTAREETIRRLENLNRELEEFTLWTTHDMREPLRSVGTLAQFLWEDFEELPPQEARDMARRVHEGAERLKERVKALHAFSQVVQRDEAFADVDLQAVTEKVISTVDMQIEERAAVVRLPEARLPVVRAQSHRIDRVLANLLENALKYGRPERPLIEIGVEETQDEWRVFVADDGPGVPADYQERIFQLFQRGPSVTAPGSGAGLAIVKRIAEQHGGRAWVECPAGGGSRFYFTLPRELEGATAAAAPQRASAAAHTTISPT